MTCKLDDALHEAAYLLARLSDHPPTSTDLHAATWRIRTTLSDPAAALALGVLDEQQQNGHPSHWTASDHLADAADTLVDMAIKVAGPRPPGVPDRDAHGRALADLVDTFNAMAKTATTIGMQALDDGLPGRISAATAKTWERAAQLAAETLAKADR